MRMLGLRFWSCGSEQKAFLTRISHRTGFCSPAQRASRVPIPLGLCEAGEPLGVALPRPLAWFGFRFHDLRHHAITELAESRASEQTIMAIAGHVSARMLNHYSHVRFDARRIALDALASKSSAGGAVAGEEGHVTNNVTNEVKPSLGGPQLIENMVDVTGIEPVTPCLQSRCSPS